MKTELTAEQSAIVTQQEIERLAREYAEANPPQTEDEKLREFGMFLNATEVFEPFLYWLLRDHCIVPKEKVMKEHEAYTFLSKAHPKASERHIAKSIAESIAVLFGADLFKERSEE